MQACQEESADDEFDDGNGGYLSKADDECTARFVQFFLAPRAQECKQAPDPDAHRGDMQHVCE